MSLNPPFRADHVGSFLRPKYLLDAREQTLIREQVPALKAAFERQIKYLEMCSAALLTIQLDPKYFDLALSAIVPLDAK